MVTIDELLGEDKPVQKKEKKLLSNNGKERIGKVVKKQIAKAYDFKKGAVQWADVNYAEIFDVVAKEVKDVRKRNNIIDGVHPLHHITCMSCGIGEYVTRVSDLNLNCDKCGEIVRGYIPTSAFIKFHQDRTRTICVFGGYGAGKTTAAINQDIEMFMINPAMSLLIGAGNAKTLSEVGLFEFLMWCPATMIKKVIKSEMKIEMIGGGTVDFRVVYDEEKIKSLSLNRIHIIESSAIRKATQRSIYEQLKKRLRKSFYVTKVIENDDEKGLAHMEKLREQTYVLEEEPIPGKRVFKIDYRQIVLESNPEPDFFLGLALASKKINVPSNDEWHDYEDMRPEHDKRLRTVTTYTFPTWVNKYLPYGTIEEWKETMTQKEIEIKIEGSLRATLNGDGFGKFEYVEPFAIPKHWKRVMSTDSGVRDARTIGAAALNPVDNSWYVYGLMGKSLWTIVDHANTMKSHLEQLPFGSLWKPIQADKQLFNTRDNDKGDGFTSNSKTYENLGLMLHKSESQKDRIKAGVSHIWNLNKQKRIKIFKPYNDYSMNQGVIVEQKMIEQISKYVENEKGELPQVKGVDGPDTLRYLLGVAPLLLEQTKEIYRNGFFQDPLTSRIYHNEQEALKGKKTVRVGSVFRKEQKNKDIYDDFDPYAEIEGESIFGI